MELHVKSEALRYLGYGQNKPDEATERLLSRAYSELTENASPKYCYKAVLREEASPLLIGADINAHVAGCEKVILFAATLSSSADGIIRRAEVSDMAYAIVADAVASALIEQVCDDAEREICGKLNIPGNGLTWRYSPGYGDYPITIQRDFIRFLQADKQIGLTATDSSVLIPRKSVTAVIGVKDDISAVTNKKSCDNCAMRETCRFRKENISCGQNN